MKRIDDSYSHQAKAITMRGMVEAARNSNGEVEFSMNGSQAELRLKRTGQLHSHKDMPAVLTAKGDAFWYEYGEKHRIGKPAIVGADGKTEFYFQGNLNEMRNENGEITLSNVSLR